MGIYLPNAGTLGCVVWPGAGISHFQGIPLIYSTLAAAATSPCHTASLPVSVTLALLPIGINVPSLNPDCQTSVQLDFLTVLGIISFEI